MSVLYPHSAAFLAGNDAPLIGDRAATRGRSAMEVGDEHAGKSNRIPPSTFSRLRSCRIMRQKHPSTNPMSARASGCGAD